MHARITLFSTGLCRVIYLILYPDKTQWFCRFNRCPIELSLTKAIKQDMGAYLLLSSFTEQLQTYAACMETALIWNIHCSGWKRERGEPLLLKLWLLLQGVGRLVHKWTSWAGSRLVWAGKFCFPSWRTGCTTAVGEGSVIFLVLYRNSITE